VIGKWGGAGGKRAVRFDQYTLCAWIGNSTLNPINMYNYYVLIERKRKFQLIVLPFQLIMYLSHKAQHISFYKIVNKKSEWINWHKTLPNGGLGEWHVHVLALREPESLCGCAGKLLQPFTGFSQAHTAGTSRGSHLSPLPTSCLGQVGPWSSHFCTVSILGVIGRRLGLCHLWLLLCVSLSSVGMAWQELGS
jgi:hypothetical protein